MTALVLSVCLLSYGFAHYYIEPSPEYRLWPYLSHSTATVAGIFMTNFFIFAAWRVMPLWPLMTRYFMHVPGYPRALQGVLNIFSHVQWEHFLANMMLFVLVGPVCADLVGRGTFLGTYISAGAVGSLFTLYWANLGRGLIGAHSVGASAAIWGISALYCLTTDQHTIKIPFIKDLEVSFWPKMLLAGFVGMELMAALKSLRSTKKLTNVDHASHIGGMLVGTSVAGYLHLTGFKEWKKAQALKGETEGTGEPGKVLDVGAAMNQEMKQIEEQVKSVVQKRPGA